MATIETREDALGLLRLLLRGAQKARSNLMESLGSDDITEGTPATWVLEQTSPWLFGPKNVVPKLAELVSAVEAGAPLRGQDLMNWTIVATRLEPSIIVCSGVEENERLQGVEADFTWAAKVW